MDRVNPQDKQEVLDWFEKYCNGFRNAKTRENILPFIFIYRTFKSYEAKDRYFRRIASELIHEGHLCSHNSKGYWFIPLVTNDREEIAALKESILEREAKARSMIRDCSKQLKRVEDLEKVINQGQMEMAV
ncbi:MAG: hypothetical protein DRP74_02160 [Candidatus Omnitrophota bacterium]|nr:MAG: hypothetical protein DRP74_02160 [Candidatus Omnitrophota bacterium]